MGTGAKASYPERIYFPGRGPHPLEAMAFRPFLQGGVWNGPSPFYPLKPLNPKELQRELGKSSGGHPHSEGPPWKSGDPGILCPLAFGVVDYHLILKPAW